MSETTGKTAAAALAKELLRDRIALVNELGAQIDAHKTRVAALAEAKTAEQDAAEQARQAYASAIAGGWTAKDLKQAGLLAPTAPRARRFTATPTDTTEPEAHHDEQS